MELSHIECLLLERRGDSLAQEAASEIDRLRAEVESLRDDVARTTALLVRANYGAADLRAEVAKLRDALRLAADEPNIDKARAIADAALGGEGGNK